MFFFHSMKKIEKKNCRCKAMGLEKMHVKSSFIQYFFVDIERINNDCLIKRCVVLFVVPLKLNFKTRHVCYVCWISMIAATATIVIKLEHISFFSSYIYTLMRWIQLWPVVPIACRCKMSCVVWFAMRCSHTSKYDI